MPEQHNIEYKASWRDDYLKWICGFANAQGGKMVIGLDDKGRVTGVENYKKLMDDIPNKAVNHLGLIVNCTLTFPYRGIPLHLFPKKKTDNIVKYHFMKDTPFISKHKEYGGKMMEFAGYNLPVVYTTIKEEHDAVRNNAGVFDVSHMGEFIIKGAHALDLIQRLTCNDVSKMKAGKAQYNCLINEEGGIIDDLLVYCIEENVVYMLVVNAANIEKDRDWINTHNTHNAELHNISDRTCQLAIQGPKAIKFMAGLADVDLTNLKYYTFVKGNFAGVENVLISATGYTGSGGIEIYFEHTGDNASKVWEAIFKNKEQTGIKPIGLGARDTLRMEMGFCLYGNDIDDTTTPLEAGLGWITKLNKKFIASSILAKQKGKGVQRKLVGFTPTDRGIPRQGYELENNVGETIGKVTSGTQSPSLKKAIGLGYVNAEYAHPGDEIIIRIRDRKIKAQVCKVPFE